MAKRGRRQPKTAPTVVWRHLLPWPVAVVAAAIVMALAGWLVCAAICMVGWLSDISQPLAAPLSLATSLFLLANGSPVVVAGVKISIMPLLLTLGIGTAGWGLIRVALRLGFSERPSATTGRVAGAAGMIAGVYGMVAAGLSGATQIGSTIHTLIGGVVIGFVTGWAAAAPLLGWRIGWPERTPAWVRACPRACGAGLGVLFAGGTLVMSVALVLARERVGALQAGLEADGVGTAILAVIQSLWTPNLAIWGVAWLVGAGFTLGVDTIVSPMAVELGVLPSIPMFGAVPDVGAPPQWMIAWLAVPVIAGMAAAWVAVRAQVTAPPVLIETGAAIGCAAGVLTGLLVTAVASASRGDLGVMRLVGLGPLLANMALLAPALLGFGGVVCGAILALRRGNVVERITPPVARMATPVHSPVPVATPPPQPWLPKGNTG